MNENPKEKIKSILEGIELEDMTTAELDIWKLVTGEKIDSQVKAKARNTSESIAEGELQRLRAIRRIAEDWMVYGC